MMAGIGAKNTKPELAVRKYLHGRGLRFRVHDKKLKGSPDLVFGKHRTVVFVNGCFWHGHKDCKRAKLPSTRKAFWKEKISGNVQRDQHTNKILEEDGWRVSTIWECEIEERKLRKLYDFITSPHPSNSPPKAL